MVKYPVVKSKALKSGKDSPNLVDIIINSIQEKKGNNLVSLDLKNIDGAICDNFIICHGNSNTQVRAIADFIIEEVKKVEGSNPWNKEGFGNMQWILIDYVDVVVHIFHHEARDFYDLEGMWGDADITSYADTNHSS